eukprot:m.75362 g.75362  ORF g.75362 m.75362 type:complete len:184 (-) comp24778_c1_seq1:720-1271(-)
MADDNDVLGDEVESPFSSPGKGPAPKMDGWGLGGAGSKKAAETDVFDDDRLRMEAPSPDDDDDSDEDIPAIMDLDKQAEEDLGMKMADAPSQQIGVTSLEELNKELKTAIPFTRTESGIDLKLLTQVLNPENMITELDEVMSFNHLFTSIKSELQTEKDLREAKQTNGVSLDDPIGVNPNFGL